MDSKIYNRSFADGIKVIAFLPLQPLKVKSLPERVQTYKRI